jgi:hypothetical protein
MPAPSRTTTPAQFRLPPWAVEFIAQRAESHATTKTDVVLEALECLRVRETEELMAEGYLARADENVRLAEEGLLAAEETLPQW